VIPGPSYGSVTATNDANNPLIVANSNHFTYAKLTRAALEEGVVLDMVVGNKIQKVGEVFVQLVDGMIVITLEGSGSFGAVASATLFNPSNGNIHSGNSFKHNNVSVIACPAGDVIYLYIHCSAWRFPVAVPELSKPPEPEAIVCEDCDLPEDECTCGLPPEGEPIDSEGEE